MSNDSKFRLAPRDLTAPSNSSWFNFRTTAGLGPHEGMIGQARAMRAVEVGLSIPTRGYNIFAVGEAGSGKTSTLVRTLKARALTEPLPDDLCYVYNFQSPDRPIPLLLPAGKGRDLAKEMERIQVELDRMIPRLLSDNAFGRIRSSIVAETRAKMEDLTVKTAQVAKRLGLFLEEGENHLRVMPLHEGKPLSEAEVMTLKPGPRKALEEKMIEFQKHVDSFAYSRRQLERDHDTRLWSAEMRAVSPMVEELIGEVASRYRVYGESIEEYLDNVKEHVTQNHRHFCPLEEDPDRDRNLDQDPFPMDGDPRVMLTVNVVVDRSTGRGAPVIVERVPNATNLSGLFEYRETPGGLVTDHSMIRAGALHQANGGYLLIQAGDLLNHENAWNILKRALRHKVISIEEGLGMGDSRPRLAGALKPGEVPLRVKVILVGGHELYYGFNNEDEEFGRLFKVMADFESSMLRTKENVQKLACFLGQVCTEENYLPLHKSAMVRILEFASRRAERKNRMITRRAEILDLLAEANMFAVENKARAIRDIDVGSAIGEIEYRHSSIRDAVAREIEAGSIMIKTAGSAVGQVNGIALYDVTVAIFGTPVRITARTYAGRRGVVNIDREVQLSGAIHDKGALILIGYLGGRFAQHQTLGFSASITFEQSYDEIDGDSASSAELYALLSSLSGAPIRQGVAVTGSVNQLGEIQPIGGVNEKIEGVFAVCAKRDLTGDQGVMIPKANVQNLMLKKEVIDAVKAGLFHIYAIETIDQGIEVLTGIPAGVLQKDGTWPRGTINARVQDQLTRLVEVIKTSPPIAMDRNL